MHIIDIIIVIAYLLLCILIGLYKSGSIKTLREYTLGKGSFSNIVISTTLFATYIGAGSVMGYIGKVYTLGLFFIVTRLSSPLCWLLMAKIYGQNIDQFIGLVSISDIMEKLYGKAGRWVTNITSIFIAIVAIAIQAVAMGHITNYFFGIGYDNSVIITVLILALYSSLGGIRAVAFTDLFQLVVIMVAMPIACSFAYHNIGGYSGIVHRLPQDMLKLDLNAENIWLFLSLILYSLLPMDAAPFIQRFLICKNSIQLTHCLNVSAILAFFLTIIICIIGLILKIKEPDIDHNIVFIHFIMEHTTVGFKGLIIAGLLAVIMSTADSWLNTISVLVTHDIISKIIPLTGKQALFTARASTFLLCILTLAITRQEHSIMELMWLVDNLGSPTLAIPLIAGFLKFRTNSKSFIAAVVVAMLSTAISGYTAGGLGTISLICGMIGSAVGLFGMHYWQVHQGIA
ncbi:MAG: sodium:solute symporter family protein [Candidatus Lariskella arthropodorum]